jgi:PBP1b-binding outer membrane lipoprotein LpoB
MRTIKILLSILLVAGFVAGCSTTRTMPVGEAKYTTLGDLKTTLNGNPPKIEQAVNGAFHDMGMQVTETRADALTGKIDAKLADGRTVNTDLKSTGANTTDVTIRVGTLGDKDISYKLLNAIQKRLQ